MKFFALCLIFLVSVAVRHGHAHILGKSAWCISNSPVHFECFYENNSTCEKMLSMRSRPSHSPKGSEPTIAVSSSESCVEFPYEFSLKPESKAPEK